MKNNNKIKIAKILMYLGVIIFIGGFSEVFFTGNYDIGFFCLFISILLMGPFYLNFCWKQSKNNEEWSIYWFVKFMTLPLAMILCIVFFIYRFLIR
jgi:hypothetical protein